MRNAVCILLPPIVTFLLFLFFSESGADPFAPPSPSHPLGVDEFGRDVLGTLTLAMLLSLMMGIILAIFALSVSFSLAFVSVMSPSRLLPLMFRSISSVFDSVPNVLWILVLLIVLVEPRLPIFAIAFTLALFPLSFNIFAGEIERLNREAFVEVARSLGTRGVKLAARHLLPNSMPVVLPLTIQAIGIAIMINGAIGILGLGNRTDSDLGILLLRGKESFLLNPIILLSTLFSIVLIYGYLLLVQRICVRS